MSKYPTSSSSRHTPPFFEFESVKQSLRISLPNANSNNQLSPFNKSNITNRNDTTSRSSNISTIEKSKNKKKKNEKSEKTDNEKEKKQKDKGIPIKEEYDERLDSQFTFKRVSKTERFTEHNTERNAERHTEQSKKNNSIKKSNSCKKSTKKGEKSKSKAKEKLNLTDKLKSLNIKLKSNFINAPLNLTENWNRHSLDLKQVHTLHTSRTFNNRSYNLNSKEKKNVDHKRGMSQELISNRKNKSVSQKSQNLSKGKDEENRDRDPLNVLKLDSKNWEIKRKIYSNSSLSSFDYCQFSPKFENEFTQEFSKQFVAFPNSEETERFDSEDEELLTMVSQDTQRIRNRMINKKEKTERNMNKETNTEKVSEDTNKMEEPPTDSNFKKKSVKFQNDKLLNIHESEEQSKHLLTVIDAALIKLTTLCTNDNQNEKHGNLREISRDDNKNRAKDKETLKDNGLESILTEGKEESLMSFKWKQEPIINKLEELLDKKVSENLLTQHEHVNTYCEEPIASRILKRNNENEKFIKIKTNFNLEEKWKQNEIKRIEKAKELLMMGLFQADKLLAKIKPKGIGNFSSESSKLLFKKGEKEQNLSKNSLKRKCKSLLNLQKEFSLTTLKAPKISKNNEKIIKNEEILSPEEFLNKPLKRPEPSEKSESSESLIDDTFIEPNEEDSIESKLPDYETDFNIDFSKIIVNPPKSNFNSPIQYKHEPSDESDIEEQSKIDKCPLGVIRELKDISKDEAEEIFEFMFIDLLLDLIEEIEINFTKPTKLFSSLKSNKTEVIQKSATKIGFNTPKEIILLLQKLSKFLEQTKDKQTIKTYKELIFERIQEPIGPKAIELLRYMREDEDEDFEVNEEEASDYEEKSSFALNIGWFQEFSKAEAEVFNFGVYYPQDKEKEAKRVSFLKSAMHIHTKAIFDSINETIDKYRPYGLIGQPFPWKAHLKPTPINKSSYHVVIKIIQKILNKTFEEVVESCRFLCGIFIEQHLSYKLSEKEHKELAEDRLNKLLCKDVQGIVCLG